MNKTWHFDMEKNGQAALTLDAENHQLILEVIHNHQRVKLTSQDIFDNQNSNLSSSGEKEYQGRYWLFHNSTKASFEDNVLTLLTCPIDAETQAPIPSFMAHYRFTFSAIDQAIHIETHFSFPGPFLCQHVRWMDWQVKGGDFTHYQGFNPDYIQPIDQMHHPVRFGSIALTGNEGWLAMANSGEVLWTPATSLENQRIQKKDAFGSLRPLGGICQDMDVSLITNLRPLRLSLAFGQGSPKLPDERVYPEVTAQPSSPLTIVKTLTSGRLQACVAQGEDGVSLYGTSLPTGSPDPATALLPLTRLLVARVSDGHRETITSQKGWKKVRVTATPKAMNIYLDQPNGIKDLAVSIEARACPNHCIEWRVKVLNANEDYAVLSATYPGTSFSGGNATVFEPTHSGLLLKDAYQRAYSSSGTYPCGFYGTTPVFGAYDESLGRGLYAAVHDDQGMIKHLKVNCFSNGQGCFEFDFPAINLGVPAAAFSLAGCLVWAYFEGDWFDMAQIYRRFIQNVQWLPPHGREDSPPWMRDVPLYIMDWMPNDNPDADPVPISIRPAAEPPRDYWVQKPIELAKALGVPFGYHLYNWHWVPFNNDFPHYFPVKEGLRDGVDALHKHHIYVMPYINGRLWDTKDCRGEDFQYQSQGLPAATKGLNGEPFVESYASHEPDGQLAKLAAMCPQSAVWRKKMAHVVQTLFHEYDMDAVYIDQVAAAHSNLCCDPNHHHRPGNGHWWVESYKLLMERLKGEVPEDRGFTTECNAEVYADQFDGFLSWAWLPSNQVPFFPAIYAGHIAMFGRNTNGYKKEDVPYFRYQVAQSLLFGQQIGWINADVVDHPAKFSFLKEMVQLRWQFKDFFSRGDMLRPPKVQGHNPGFITDTGMGMPVMFSGETLLAGAWQKRDDHRAAIILINIGDGEQQVEFSTNWDEDLIDYQNLKALFGQGRLEAILPGTIRATLPPQGCLVLG